MSAERDAGMVEIPVESASRTRREDNWQRNSGNTRSGFAEILSSSKQLHAARAGESDAKKFAEISSASNDVLIWGSVVVKNDGTELGVLEPPTRRCVVPEPNSVSINIQGLLSTKSPRAQMTEIRGCE